MCMHLFMYVFISVLFTRYLCFVCRHITTVYMLAWSSHICRLQTNRVRSPILFVVSCVYMRAYNCTCTRRVQTATYPGHKHTNGPRHKRMYTHAKLQRYTSTRANSSTRVHYVRHSGCPYQILYGYKYSVRAQARGHTHNQCIAQAVHVKILYKHIAYVQSQALMYTA